jgi:hypothetical protein
MLIEHVENREGWGKYYKASSRSRVGDYRSISIGRPLLLLTLRPSVKLDRSRFISAEVAETPRVVGSPRRRDGRQIAEGKSILAMILLTPATRVRCERPMARNPSKRYEMSYAPRRVLIYVNDKRAGRAKTTLQRR